MERDFIIPLDRAEDFKNVVGSKFFKDEEPLLTRRRFYDGLMFNGKPHAAFSFRTDFGEDMDFVAIVCIKLGGFLCDETGIPGFVRLLKAAEESAR